jgi:FkbM family methyltransferase
MHTESVVNVYLKNANVSNKSLIYYAQNDTFANNNWPSDIRFDYDIKMDIVNFAMKLEKNSCIIDCGAHIGDGVIPIAHALKKHNRHDIMIYAIDPSREKCNAIEMLCKMNKLDNVTVLNYGLTNEICTLFPNIPKDKNTGGTVWIPERINTAGNAENYTVGDSFTFDTLDNLVKEGVITHKIGIIHLDVEGHEYRLIEGGINTIMKDLPYLSLEDHQNDVTKFDKLLVTNYKFVKRLHYNNVFLPK